MQPGRHLFNMTWYIVSLPRQMTERVYLCTISGDSHLPMVGGVPLEETIYGTL